MHFFVLCMACGGMIFIKNLKLKKKKNFHLVFFSFNFEILLLLHKH